MNIKKKGIEFSICTHNRVAYLKKCIEPLLPGIREHEMILTVIDNGSGDDTKSYMRQLIKDITGIRYIEELNPGLSHARNRAWKESIFEWIFYLDDDCVPEKDLVTKALSIIRENPVADMYGGMIYPIFESSPPAWIPEGYGRFSMPFEKITLIKSGYVRGGCMMIKTKVLEELGGFNADLGMKGLSMGYGEELDLQARMREHGYRIAYAPELKTGHVVRAEKMNLSWLLLSEYTRSRDKMAFNPVSFTSATTGLIRTSASRLYWAPVHLMKAFRDPTYSLKNAALDSLRPLMSRWGMWMGLIKYRKKKSG